MEEEGEKWSGIELIVVAKKFEANLIKVRDRRWSSKLRWYLRSQLLSLYQLLLREKKKRSEPSNYLFFLVSYILLRENSVLPWPQNLPLYKITFNGIDFSDRLGINRKLGFWNMNVVGMLNNNFFFSVFLPNFFLAYSMIFQSRARRPVKN